MSGKIKRIIRFRKTKTQRIQRAYFFRYTFSPTFS